MTIRLNPHAEQLLKEQLAHGVFQSPEEVIEHALERLRDGERSSRAVDLAEFEATLDALAEGSEKIPILPDEAFTRAGIYRDHK